MPAVGDKAPSFTLQDQDGTQASLSEWKGDWLVLYFYPKDDTPGCTVEACEFSASVPRFGKLHAVVVGVSPDSPEAHRKFIEKKKLKIRLLSDAGSKVSGKYGVWVEKNMYGKKYMGVARTTFLIDPEGRVAHVFEKVKPEGHAEEVRRKLVELQRPA